MENNTVVTLNDNYIFREDVDSTKMTWLSNVVAHELAHHWFGNLVTMDWWNDLWLKESFADFISHFCMSKYEI
jgi:aminopeptidase N